MPVVHIDMLKGHSLKEKRAMVAAITEALMKTLKVPAAYVNIVINEMAVDQNAVGGELILDLERKQQKTKKR